MEKILIVEDDLSFRTIIQAWLRKKGFEVEKTTSVKSAIAAWEETAKQGNAARGFDLVLSDLRLPDKDGIFLLRWMREHGMKEPSMTRMESVEALTALSPERIHGIGEGQIRECLKMVINELQDILAHDL